MMNAVIDQQPRRNASEAQVYTCVQCGATFWATRLNAKFCSGACRAADFRIRHPDVRHVCPDCGASHKKRASRAV